MSGAELPAWPGPGCWVVASAALGRPVPVGETPYAHICGAHVTAPASGKTVRISRGQCSACLVEAGPAPEPVPLTGEAAALAAALDARRTGERE